MGDLRLKLAKYSIGTGDRFAHQAKAQLQACILALKSGVEVVPVWNKSNREHTIIASEPATTRAAADAAVKALGWKLALGSAWPTPWWPECSPADIPAGPARSPYRSSPRRPALAGRRRLRARPRGRPGADRG